MSDAMIGFIGVVIGALLTPVIDSIKSARTTKKDARYLAIRVVCILDQFTDMCVAVAQDDGEEDQDGITHYPAPNPVLQPFPDDLDWKSIDHKMMYDILSLPNKIDATKRYIQAACELWIFPPYDELGPELQYEYSALGLLSMDIADRLCKKYDIDISSEIGKARNPSWNAREYLSEKKKKIEEIKKEQEKAREDLQNNMAEALKVTA